MGNTLYSVWWFEQAKHITTYTCVGTDEAIRISLRFSSNSELNVSELIQNHKEMFPRYWYGSVDHV